VLRATYASEAAASIVARDAAVLAAAAAEQRARTADSRAEEAVAAAAEVAAEGDARKKRFARIQATTPNSKP
jgi:hypothetical protein